jgi:hypothetical protein
MKKQIKKSIINEEFRRMQKLAGLITEGILNEELKNIESELKNAGLSFDDGILGGVGSGGGGYYDFISDKISGYNLDKFNQNEFNKWYDNFSKDNFNSFTYKKGFNGENIDYNIIDQIGKGIYAVGDPGYGGYAKINDNGDITLYATPTLSDENGMEFFPIFSLNSNGSTTPEMSKEEIEDKLKQNQKTQEPGQ